MRMIFWEISKSCQSMPVVMEIWCSRRLEVSDHNVTAEPETPSRQFHKQQEDGQSNSNRNAQAISVNCHSRPRRFPNFMTVSRRISWWLFFPPKTLEDGAAGNSINPLDAETKGRISAGAIIQRELNNYIASAKVMLSPSSLLEFILVA
jgi:hypothetical protein